MIEKPTPSPTPETQEFWDGCRRGELTIPRCTRCDRHFFYPRPACPHCGSTEVRWDTVSGRGRVHSYVISHLKAPGFDPPYVIAVVELDEGPRMLSNIVGVPAEPGAITVDMPVRVEFEPRGDQAVPVFRPTEGATA